MSAVDRYLDLLFDRLSGTGSTGRRALAEAEDHLRSAVADGESADLTTEQAEAEAVRQFGSPDRIVHAARRASRGLWAFASALSGAWLFAGLAVATVGLAYAGRVADIALLLRMHPEPGPQCGATFLPTLSAVSAGVTSAVGCSETVSQLHAFLADGATTLAIAAIILGVRWWLIRRGSLLPAGRYSTSLTAVGLLILAAFAFLTGPTTFTQDRGPGFQLGFVILLAGVVVTIALIVASATRSGRNRSKLRATTTT